MSTAETNVIRWEDPPRDYRDGALDIALQLRDNPGRWALVLQNSPEIRGYELELGRWGDIEVRLHGVREVESGHPHYRVWDQGDLYARALPRSRFKEMP